MASKSRGGEMSESDLRTIIEDLQLDSFKIRSENARLREALETVKSNCESMLNMVPKGAIWGAIMANKMVAEDALNPTSKKGS